MYFLASPSLSLPSPGPCVTFLSGFGHFFSRSTRLCLQVERPCLCYAQKSFVLFRFVLFLEAVTDCAREEESVVVSCVCAGKGMRLGGHSRASRGRRGLVFA